MPAQVAGDGAAFRRYQTVKLAHRYDARIRATAAATKVVDLACGASHSLVVCADGHASRRGAEHRSPRGPRRRGGDPSRDDDAAAPRRASDDASRRRYASGANDRGQLGTGDLRGRRVPARVAFAEEDQDDDDEAPQFFQDGKRPARLFGDRVVVVAVACGPAHSGCCTTGGVVYCWGDNTNGKLGVGRGVKSARPERTSYFLAVVDRATSSAFAGNWSTCRGRGGAAATRPRRDVHGKKRAGSSTRRRECEARATGRFYGTSPAARSTRSRRGSPAAAIGRRASTRGATGPTARSD